MLGSSLPDSLAEQDLGSDGLRSNLSKKVCEAGASLWCLSMCLFLEGDLREKNYTKTNGDTWVRMPKPHASLRQNMGTLQKVWTCDGEAIFTKEGFLWWKRCQQLQLKRASVQMWSVASGNNRMWPSFPAHSWWSDHLQRISRTPHS